MTVEEYEALAAEQYERADAASLEWAGACAWRSAIDIELEVASREMVESRRELVIAIRRATDARDKVRDLTDLLTRFCILESKLRQQW